MRSTLLGLTVPLLLLGAAFATAIPQAAAQGTFHEVSGRVVSDAGDPLANVHVSGWTMPADGGGSSDGKYRSHETRTDADGRFTLQLAPGKGHLNVYHEDWRQGEGREILVEGDVSDITFTLRTPPPKTAIIAGEVIGPDGRPVEGAEVRLEYGCCYAMPAATDAPAPEPATAEPSDAQAEDERASTVATRPAIMPPYHDDHQTQTTGPDGRFEFKAYAGPRQVTAWAKGFAQTTIPVQAVDGERTEITLKLEKVPARDAVFTGRVVDSLTGLPVAGAHVSVRSLEWSRYAEATTGKDGTYRIQTVPGWSEVSVNFWSYAEPIPLAAEGDVAATSMIARAPAVQYYPFAILVDLESGDQTRDLHITPKPKPTISLVGYVVDPEAQTGVAGARVHVWNVETGDWGEAVTDATGSFKLLVRAGHYQGNAYKEGYLGGTQSFRVTDEPAQRVDLILPRGIARWAPCYDDECGPIAYYADAKAESGAATAADGAPTAPPQPMTAGAESARAADAGAQPDRSGAAAFEGSGGGLPPYTPASANQAPTSQRAVTNEVPAPGALVVLGLLGALAVALHRRTVMKK